MPRNKAAHAHYRIQRLPSTEFAAKLEFSESVYYREFVFARRSLPRLAKRDCSRLKVQKFKAGEEQDSHKLQV
jgi:hypothetical protein